MSWPPAAGVASSAPDAGARLETIFPSEQRQEPIVSDLARLCMQGGVNQPMSRVTCDRRSSMFAPLNDILNSRLVHHARAGPWSDFGCGKAVDIGEWEWKGGKGGTGVEN